MFGSTWMLHIAEQHAGDVLLLGGDGLAEPLRSVALSVMSDVDIDDWGLEPAMFDVALLVGVLGRMPLAPTLERTVQLLKPGGELLVEERLDDVVKRDILEAQTAPGGLLDGAWTHGGLGGRMRLRWAKPVPVHPVASSRDELRPALPR